MKRAFCTVSELSSLLGVTDQAIYKWLKEDTIRGRKIGSVWRIPISEVVRLVGYNPYEEEESSSKPVADYATLWQMEWATAA